jgi:aryl-alcohol dehydrogenase-like predicted oxidoreductase
VGGLGASDPQKVCAGRCNGGKEDKGHDRIVAADRAERNGATRRLGARANPRPRHNPTAFCTPDRGLRLERSGGESRRADRSRRFSFFDRVFSKNDRPRVVITGFATLTVVRYRRLGLSDLHVSAVSLGSWKTYGGGGISDEQARECLDAAFACGVNFIDTANVYSNGASESFLGEALKKRPRESYILATKLRFAVGDGSGEGLSAAQVHKQIDQSLRRLQTDYVDLYQCHRPDPETPLEETLEALTEIVRMGKVRYLGFSEFPPALIGESLDLARERGYARFVSSQPEYSLLHRDPEAEVIPLCQANGISQIVWSPLAEGVLSGKYPPGSSPPPDTRATSERMGATVGRRMDDATLERVHKLRPIAERLGVSIAQLALAWILREENVAAAIVGASRPEQVRENAIAGDIKLDEETIATVDAIFP